MKSLTPFLLILAVLFFSCKSDKEKTQDKLDYITNLNNALSVYLDNIPIAIDTMATDQSIEFHRKKNKELYQRTNNIPIPSGNPDYQKMKSDFLCILNRYDSLLISFNSKRKSDEIKLDNGLILKSVVQIDCDYYRKLASEPLVDLYYRMETENNLLKVQF
jgi:hypothetical protein